MRKKEKEKEIGAKRGGLETKRQVESSHEIYSRDEIFRENYDIREFRY